MRRNLFVLIFGLLLMAISFAGVFLLGQVFNPPAVLVVVASRDFNAGDVVRLQDLATVSVHIDETESGFYDTVFLQQDVQFLNNKIITQPVAAGQPIPRNAIVAAGNESGGLSGQLEDSNLIALVVPVTEETAPPGIRAGDYVDLVYGVTGASYAPVVPPTDVPYQAYGAPLVLEPPTPDPVAVTPTPVAMLYVPLAKTIVTNALVLDLVRETTTSSQVTANGQTVVREVAGPVTALVLAVPRDAQEVVQFALDTGVVRVSLLSANARADGTRTGERRPTLGMTWNDLVALLEMERDQRLQAGLPTEITGAGQDLWRQQEQAAQAAEAAAQATPIPPATATPTAELSPTPTVRP
ncbi:MAG: hypothetical protein JNL73_11455 [Anaerolineales bacterium]|nr:hypothetical protein [Anaerolineales bacterium]